LANTVGLRYKVIVPDVQKFFDDANEEMEAVKAKANASAPLDFYDTYQNLANIQSYIAQLGAANPTLVTPISIGQSLQSRNIFGIKITRNNNLPNKRVIVFNGGQHAREWITPVTVVYLAEQLLSTPALLENIEWHIIPVLNPDGYLHTWASSTNRNHRKNMRQNAGGCLGVDNNRNWNSNWNRGGSSTNPCADNYMGPSANSEPENRLMGQYLQTFPNGFCYLDIHAYGYLWMTPYGWTNALPSNYQEQLALSNRCAAAIRQTTNSNFRTGNVYNTIYQASGASNDFGYDVARFRHSFALELRGTSFNPPVGDIRISGREIWAAMQEIGRSALSD
jgi:hypothetical protein